MAMLTGSDMSHLDSDTCHADVTLPVTISHRPQFLISSVEQLLLGCRGLFEQLVSGCADYLNTPDGS